MKSAKFTILAIVVTLAVLALGAKPGPDQKGGLQKGSSVTTSGDYTVFDVNNVSTYVRNNGSFDRDPGTGNAGYEWPKGSGNTAIYASGLWLGGKSNSDGVVRVAVAEYSYEFDAGPIINGQAADPNDPSYRMYKIRRGDDATTNPDYANWPVQDGAPVDENGDPLLLGDMTVWCVFNEADPSVHVNMNAQPLGVEVQMTAFGFNRADALGNAIFYKWKVINKGGRTLDSTYITVWSDPDLGDSGDDYDGCDTTLGLGFIYNGDAVDGTYGTPPAAGFDFLQGPLVPGAPTDTARFPDGRVFPGKRLLKMTSFIKYSNDQTDLGNPGTGQEVLNYMKGVTRTGQVIRGPQGNATTFMFPGDPNVAAGPTNWIETDPPGDRRFMMSAGPFVLAAGDTQEIVAASIIAQGASAPASVTALKNADALVQTAYDADFKLPPPPAPPIVVATPYDQAIVLSWGDGTQGSSRAASIEETATLDPIAEAGGAHDPYYRFQGYVVYQVPSLSSTDPGDWKIIKTFDRPGNIEPIYDDVFDPTLGYAVSRPVKLGENKGVERTIRITMDAFAGVALSNSKDYYYCVTSYTYGAESVPKTLESSLNVFSARPSKQPGVRYASAYGDTIPGVVHTGPSDGSAMAFVKDPGKVTGHQYTLGFEDVGGEVVWYVTDVATGQRKVTGQTNQTGDDAYPTFDGIQMKVLGPRPGMKEWSIPNGTRRFSWAGGFAGLGLEGFGSSTEDEYNTDEGTIGMAGHFAFGGIGTNLTTAQYRTVLLKLAAVDNVALWDPLATPSDPNISRGYRYLRAATAAPAQPSFVPWIINAVGGYPYQDFNYSVPFSAWDMETTPPTRLAVGSLENNVTAGLVDGRYWPPTPDGDNTASREFAFIFATPYSETPDPALQVNISNNSSIPLMWVMVCSRRAEVPWVAGDEFEIVAAHVNMPADVFTVNTASYVPSRTTDNEKTDISLVNVVPNPYYGASAYERNQFNRTVRFTNLPTTATIRIYNLVGDLVRTLRKEGAGTTIDWDLQNENALPVASGMYIAYVDMPGLGTRALKLAVIMSEERLDNF